MKHFLAACFVGLFPVIASAQSENPLDAPTKPKPTEPIIASQHGGAGRIGVRLSFAKDTGIPEISGLTQGGPASDFGFRVGDVIIKIDKNYTNSLSEDEIKLSLHGEPGTGVELTVQRGDDPRLIVRAIKRRALPAHAEDIPEAVVTETKP